MTDTAPVPAGKWDRRFLDLAHHISGWSRDPSTKVGAVIVRPDKTIASVGFNGFPRGVADLDERYADRPTKYRMVVHAEANAIVSAREPLHGCSLYVHPLFPCSSCAALAIQAGIVRVATPPPEGDLERWRESFEASAEMFVEAGVAFDLVETRAQESLRLAAESRYGTAQFRDIDAIMPSTRTDY